MEFRQLTEFDGIRFWQGYFLIARRVAWTRLRIRRNTVKSIYVLTHKIYVTVALFVLNIDCFSVANAVCLSWFDSLQVSWFSLFCIIAPTQPFERLQALDRAECVTRVYLFVLLFVFSVSHWLILYMYVLRLLLSPLCYRVLASFSGLTVHDASIDFLLNLLLGRPTGSIQYFQDNDLSSMMNYAHREQSKKIFSLVMLGSFLFMEIFCMHIW
jgi:hypothetical protein